jgi:hypothetical protein
VAYFKLLPRCFLVGLRGSMRNLCNDSRNWGPHLNRNPQNVLVLCWSEVNAGTTYAQPHVVQNIDLEHNTTSLHCNKTPNIIQENTEYWKHEVPT